MVGLARTVPEDMAPGSDVANMGIMGYDPAKYYSGRAAIEAAALGVELGSGEAAFRMNLVTLGGDPADPVMEDYSAGHPTAKEQKAVLKTLTEKLGGSRVKIMPGVGFRNLCVVSDFEGGPDLRPPHDHAGEKISGIRPSGPGSELIGELQRKAREALADHPVNAAREKAGKPPINGVWFWGAGRPASMPSFFERHGKSGAVVTGVDLIRGLARILKMEIMEVAGATGYIDTNYEGKARGALDALERVDFVFLHVEASDETAHEGNLDLKIKAIEEFDKRAVSAVLDGLRKFDGYRVLLMPDHETPVRERGHRGGPVPFAVANKEDLEVPGPVTGVFSERYCRENGRGPLSAPTLLETLLFS